MPSCIDSICASHLSTNRRLSTSSVVYCLNKYILVELAHTQPIELNGSASRLCLWWMQNMENYSYIFYEQYII